MSQGKARYYEVYRKAEKIRLEEIILEAEETGSPSLKVCVSIDGRTIKNVAFKRDITSKAYAVPPMAKGNQSSEVTILFGGQVQEILDRFADYILPPMKPLGINQFTGEKVLDIHDRTDVREIKDTKRKIRALQFIWQR
jgi:hypothetical protein